MSATVVALRDEAAAGAHALAAVTRHLARCKLAAHTVTAYRPIGKAGVRKYKRRAVLAPHSVDQLLWIPRSQVPPLPGASEVGILRG